MFKPLDMGVKKLAHFTIVEYLDLERETDKKHEYHNGEVFAMSGGTINHALLCGNIYTELRSKTKGKDCKAILSEAKIGISSANSYVYPDAMVVCGEIQKSPKEPNAITNPIIIVEVLSKSTNNYDRGDKFFKYRQLASLREYVLIEQDTYTVEVFSKKEGTDLWKIDRYSSLDETIALNSIGVKIPMEEIYFDIKV